MSIDTKKSAEVFSFDVGSYPFRRHVADIFGCDELEEIHIRRRDLMPTLPLVFETESKTPYHEAFYQAVNVEPSPFRRLYRDFVADVVTPIIGEPFIFQYQPSFRVHLPEDKAVHKWHSDGDEDHNHPPGEINFIVPMTECYGTAAVWAESEPDRGDFAPMELDYGQFVRFDGNRCRHGNQENTTARTRISLDFRVLPRRFYHERPVGNGVSSITSGKKFRLGSYYATFEET
jgi:hypothetical protein